MEKKCKSCVVDDCEYYSSWTPINPDKVLELELAKAMYEAFDIVDIKPIVKLKALNLTKNMIVAKLEEEARDAHKI